MIDAGAPQRCRTDLRRARVRAADLNGVDGVEADDQGTTLTVTFLGRAPEDLGPDNIRIDGGRRITGIHAVDARVEMADDPDLDDLMRVEVNTPGDTSAYTLSVVESDAHGRPGTEPYPGFDPRYHSAEFSFRVACPTDFDCAATEPEPRPRYEQPVIDYTARDYARLRRLLLDRMTLTAGKWVERHVPDLGLTLVEALAYVGEQLGYQQDAVMTEAYLDTARRRVSVRRHVRLVDYAMHDGCNARTWVALRAGHDLTIAGGGYRFASIDVSRLAARDRPELGTVISDEQLASLPPAATVEVFEPIPAGPLTLVPAHNRIPFWTWGERECCLPEGATSATLRDTWTHRDSERDRPRRRALRLSPGDVVIIEEVLGPRTGTPADADPGHRQAVRLTSVTPGVDELYDQPVVEIGWSAEDALGFEVCVSSRGGPDCAPLDDVSVVTGNVVLADHGRSNVHCGNKPEIVEVPPAEITAPSCEPPAFGCADGRAADPAVGKIHALLAEARAGEPLDGPRIAELAPLVGPAALDRAGLVADVPAAGQVLALEALLAQVTYPPVRRRFRPVLSRTPVTQRVAFPDQAQVSAAQAALLAGIPPKALARLRDLWRHSRHGNRPTPAQVAELTVLFGAAVLDEVGLDAHPARALRELIARFDSLLAAELRRIGMLAARARAGEVLGPDVSWEIGQSWGAAYADGLDPGDARLRGPASTAVRQDPRSALPAVEVRAEAGIWTPRRDLLTAGPRDRHFVGELEDDGRLALRFGDGRHGAPPSPGGELRIGYRVGSGMAGNVGAEAVGHLVLCRGVTGGDGVLGVRNPVPAVGGTDPEALDQVRQLAPLSLHRTRLRAVTGDDYAELATGVFGVRRAAARLRWTGSGEEVRVAVDPAGEEVLEAVAARLDSVRQIGHRVTVGPVSPVPIDLGLTVCLDAGFQRGHVAAALRGALRAEIASLGFGEPVRLSRIVVAAAAVPGVTSARVTRLGRQFRPPGSELEDGLLPLGPLEIAQLDDDLDRPENGRLSLVFGGGR